MNGETGVMTRGTKSASEVGQQSLFYYDQAKDFVDLHEQVETSVNLLDSLESFLSTFQKDLSSVSGQISELQERSKDIDNRLKSRRRIEKPLSSLLSDLAIPPSLAITILDTDVGEPWIATITDFERRLGLLKVRSRVKAARDLGDVAEGLRIVAATKLRTFFLALLQPIRTSVTTNMQVMQTSIFVKYRALYAFLQRQAPNVAGEIQKAYTSTARTYYETGFRRYVRSLGWIKARTPEKPEPIISRNGDNGGPYLDQDRLAYAKIDGPSVILAYMADDKTHEESIEAILRSLFLVLMDNTTAEYAFIAAFFRSESFAPPPAMETNSALFSPTATLLSPDVGFDDRRSNAGSEIGTHVSRTFGGNGNGTCDVTARPGLMDKAERAPLDAIWKQILDPVLEYCKTFVTTVLEPMPPAVPLLTMIRLTEAVITEVQKRDCPPLENFLFTMRLQLWPAFQKIMSEHCDTLRKLAEGGTSSYFNRAVSTTDASVANICNKYVVMFNSFVILTDQEEETMIFSNLLRLRQELTKLIARHTENINDDVAKATKQSAMYEVLLQGLNKGTHLSTHPKSQKEIAYWAEKEEEARRRIVSIAQSRRIGKR
ncbi:Vps52-domain-containing protein [Suillus subaureus]|uniref:Vps52-domain-containing protein n=1 Tax=Suillus subaureus TaxID=48587 RepID=A0A9P7E9N9_9AGAM|nr:Vps52-domain-containing protein [Suillus subaureus]KAG1815552.1 Vps52-domain-containing protein [Suillus subaureus]